MNVNLKISGRLTDGLVDIQSDLVEITQQHLCKSAEALLEDGWLNPETGRYHTGYPAYSVSLEVERAWVRWVRDISILDVRLAHELIGMRKKIWLL